MVELILFVLLIFILGACIGSFLTVVIDRSQKHEQIVHGRSHCDYCNHVLGFFDLLPLFSYLFLGGQCRYCKKRLSFFYPLIEGTTGLLFAATILAFFPISGDPSLFHFGTVFYLLMLMAVFVVIFFSDMRYGVIPLPAIVVGVVSSFFYLVFFQQPELFNHLLSAVISFLFLFSIFFLTKGKGIGFGDVLYAFFMGLVLGFPLIVISYYLAFLTGAGVSLILILSKRKKIRGSTIAFGPFLVFGTIINLFFGAVLLSFVLSFFS